MPAYEPWIWTELLAFDNTAADLGVAAYLEKIGFTPTAVLLLLGSPELVLRHESPLPEQRLRADICSRRGQPGNEDRRRQDWTTWQLRDLVANLRRAGVATYLSLFTVWEQDKFGREWLSDHPECLGSWDFQGYGLNLNPLARLRDGTPFAAIFAPRLVRVMEDYGFAGWHGPDGWGPLCGAIRNTDFSDGMTAQFADWLARPLPVEARDPCGNEIPKLLRRSAAIWRDLAPEWIRFNAELTAAFWKTITTALHGIGRQSLINSAWTKAPFESLYRYGIDYRLIAETGVDGMVVETCAASLGLGTGDRDRHDEAAAMLMLINACVPQLKLLFLHTVKDVFEEYDAIRHSPTNLERDVFTLANQLHLDRRGQARRSAAGFAVCLGDGITAAEWRWLTHRWELAYGFTARPAAGVTVLWSDAFIDRQLDDYLATARADVHRLIWQLRQAGAALPAAVRIEDIAACSGPLLVPNHHLLPPGERQRLARYAGGPVLLLGGPEDLPPGARLLLTEGDADRSIGLYRLAAEPATAAPERLPAPPPPPPPPASKELGFRDDIPWQPVSEAFFARAAAILNTISDAPECRPEADHTIRGGAAPATLMVFAEASGDAVVIVKNASFFYARRQVDMKRPLATVTVLSGFPANHPHPEGTRFSIKIPPRGAVIVRVHFA